MQHAIIIRGRYAGGTFLPDEPLPDGEGPAELIITPLPAGGARSIAEAFGKASVLRTGEEILAQVQADREEWGDR